MYVEIMLVKKRYRFNYNISIILKELYKDYYRDNVNFNENNLIIYNVFILY